MKNHFKEYLLQLFFLLLNVYCIQNNSLDSIISNCPCNLKSYCLPVNESIYKKRNEIFGFSPDSESNNWKYFDWKKITTIAWNVNKNLLCHAHKNGVKVVILHNFDNVQLLCNRNQRKQWIQEGYHKIIDNYADGINIDIEKPLYGKQSTCLTLLLKELRQALQKYPFTKNSHVTFDVPWSPSGIDNRYYEWKEMAEYVDFFVIMSYDMRSQIYYQCLAESNSPYFLVKKGIEEYINEYKITNKKLILALPWYGYVYPCISFTLSKNYEFCEMNQVPFQGAPCSDAAGKQIPYGDIIQHYLAKNENKYDNISMTPYINIIINNSHNEQLWYDDPNSLKKKYKLATTFGLTGIGIWNIDLLDYSGRENPNKETKLMWDTLPNIPENKMNINDYQVKEIKRIYSIS